MSLRIKILLFVVTALVSVYVGAFAVAPATALDLFQETGYYTIALSVALFGWFLLRAYYPGGVALRRFFGRREILFGLLVALVGALLLLKGEPLNFKTIMDEHVLANTAKKMHHHREVEATTRALPVNGALASLRGYVDKRPILYPFLVASVSDLTGYRPRNGVYLNVLLTPLILFLLYYTVLRCANLKAATASVALLCSLPLLGYLCAGGGLEPINILFIILTWLLGGLYLAKPGPERLGAFCLSGILLAQCRYESVLFILAVGLVVLWSWWRERRIELSWPLFLCPPLLIPYLWQNRIFQLKSHMWQMDDVMDADKPFSLAHMADNFGRAYGYFFNFNHGTPNSWLVVALGLVALLLFAVAGARQLRHFRELRPELQSGLLFLPAFFALFLLLLAYGWDFDHQIIRRLNLPLHIPLAVAGAYLVFYRFPQRWVHRAGALGIALYFVAYVLPITNQRLYSKTYAAGLEFDAAEAFVQEHPYKPHLYIADNAGFFYILGEPTLSSALANIRKEAIKFYLQQPLALEVLHFEQLVYDPVKGAFRLSSKGELDAAFIKETVWERNITEMRKVRFSRIIDVEGVELDATTYESLSDYLHDWGRNLP